MILQAMKSQTSTSPWLNRLLKPLEGLLAGMLLAIWLVVLLQVMLRYGFGISIQGANESIVLLFVYTSALGATVGLGHREHLSVSILIDRLSTQNQRRMTLLHHGAMALFHLAIAGLSLGWIAATGQFIMPSTELPRWIAQISIPLMGALGALICLLHGIHAFQNEDVPQERQDSETSSREVGT